MGLVLQYLSSHRTRLLNTLVVDKFDPESFYRTQGSIQMIDDILGIPQLLENNTLREMQ